MKTFRNLLTTIALVFCCLLFIGTLNAQEKPPQEGLSDEEKAQANNPLARMKGLNVQVYFRPELSELEGASAHQEVARMIFPVGGRTLWRLSVPMEQRNINNSTVNFSDSGIGDIDIFGAYLAVMKPKLTFGIGPSFAFNTAHANLGSGRNSAGAAAVIFAIPNPAFQIGGLVIYRTDIGGDDSRPDAHLLALQPFYIFQAGKGLYFGGAPVIPFNLTSGDYHIPLGMRIGKVIKIDRTILNFFIEPQPSMVTKGVGQPQFQIYGALNMQFK